MDQSLFEEAIDTMPDDVLNQIAASMPWASVMGGEVEVLDEDGFSVTGKGNSYKNFRELQNICWNKFLDNPQINSHVRDFMGNLTGSGFSMGSDNPELSDFMKTIIEDPRNALYRNMTKFVARSEIEGELFLSLTVHADGFIEVDFMSPRSLTQSGYKNSGIHFHPDKSSFPLFYEFDISDVGETHFNKVNSKLVVPSINIAYYPTLKNFAKDFNIANSALAKSTAASKKFSKIGNYKRFIIEWDRGFLTTRNVSHLRTTIVWIEHYENLKKWEIDHKKSSGSYLWVAHIEDAKAFRTWLKMNDDQKKNTGLFAKKKPGGTLVLPPGIRLECINPNLPKISDADTDIMSMVISGLNKPEDMVTGQTKGSTFSGVKASRGPMADRVQDQMAYFERFLQFDFWRPIFFLSNAVNPNLKLEYRFKEVVDFKNQKPISKTVIKKAHDILHFEFPVSEVSNLGDKASALLGVKHPSLVETLGIPREEVAKKLGFGNYRKRRLQIATEEETFPKLPTTIELEMIQETGGETKNPKDEDGNPPKKPKEEEKKPVKEEKKESE
jgi:hypothetical protein